MLKDARKQRKQTTKVQYNDESKIFCISYMSSSEIMATQDTKEGSSQPSKPSNVPKKKIIAVVPSAPPIVKSVSADAATPDKLSRSSARRPMPSLLTPAQFIAQQNLHAQAAAQVAAQRAAALQQATALRQAAALQNRQRYNYIQIVPMAYIQQNRLIRSQTQPIHAMTGYPAQFQMGTYYHQVNKGINPMVYTKQVAHNTSKPTVYVMPTAPALVQVMAPGLSPGGTANSNISVSSVSTVPTSGSSTPSSTPYTPPGGATKSGATPGGATAGATGTMGIPPGSSVVNAVANSVANSVMNSVANAEVNNVNTASNTTSGGPPGSNPSIPTPLSPVAAIHPNATKGALVPPTYSCGGTPKLNGKAATASPHMNGGGNYKLEPPVYSSSNRSSSSSSGSRSRRNSSTSTYSSSEALHTPTPPQYYGSPSYNSNTMIPSMSCPPSSVSTYGGYSSYNGHGTSWMNGSGTNGVNGRGHNHYYHGHQGGHHQNGSHQSHVNGYHSVDDHALDCEWHGSAAGCRFGDQCTFNHNNPNSIKICKEYAAGLGCDYGDSCYCRHWDFERNCDLAPRGALRCGSSASGSSISGSSASSRSSASMSSSFRDDRGYHTEYWNPSRRQWEKSRKISSKKRKKRKKKRMFKRMDEGLAAYYEECGRDDYLNTNQKGKFLCFVHQQNLDHIAVEQQLGNDVDLSECTLLEMDSDFPFPDDIEIDDIDNDIASDSDPVISVMDSVPRQRAMLDVLRRCWLFGKYTMMNQYGGGDWNLFKDSKTSDDRSTERCSFGKHKPSGHCAALRRAINSLIYFSKFYEIQKHESKQQLLDFVDMTYSKLIRDYMHIMRRHADSKQIDHLHRAEAERFQQIQQCDTNNCLLLYRHKNAQDDEGQVDDHEDGRDGRDGKEEEENNVLFYRDLMDAMHCYLVHQYDIGIRIKVRDSSQYSDDEMDDARWRRWERNSLYKFVCQIACHESDVFVFCTQWCHARSH